MQRGAEGGSGVQQCSFSLTFKVNMLLINGSGAAGMMEK
jgi:hypothetical protein